MSNSNREDAKINIGKRMAEARRIAGLSQQRVADRLGIPQRTLSYYECGNGDIPCSLLVPLADILKVDPYWLLGPKPAASCRKQAGMGYLQKRFEAIRNLSKKDQQFVIKFLDITFYFLDCFFKSLAMIQ